MEERLALEVSFSEQEIWEVLKACDGYKAPSPDGFNLSFFKCFWPIVKGEVLDFFNDFHESGKLVNYNCLETVYDFRPISLIGSAYKLISKVLASRLQKLMPKAISENQFAFTQGSKIARCILTANEVVDCLKRRHGRGILLKLDFVKAYDNVE